MNFKDFWIMLIRVGLQSVLNNLKNNQLINGEHKYRFYALNTQVFQWHRNTTNNYIKHKLITTYFTSLHPK